MAAEESAQSKSSFAQEQVSIITKEVINTHLQQSMVYNHLQANDCIKVITKDVLDRIVALQGNFKYIVTCSIVQRNGGGLCNNSLCHWDESKD
eukprot:Ihof_evm10s57 gene=Ihof_evmTU10s57